MNEAEMREKALEMYARMQKLDAHVRPPGPGEEWMTGEGIPVYETLAGVADVRDLPREQWDRVGGKGTFIQMLSLYQSEKGMFVVEIPPGKALNPERHLYEAFLFVLQGRGATEIWQEGTSAKVTFEWGEGSAFVLPLNSWHRLINGSSEPALIFALTSAPRVMNVLHYTEFVLNCDHVFEREFNGEPDHFSKSEPFREGTAQNLNWRTNFLPDARTYGIEDGDGHKAWGGAGITFWMGQRWPRGGISQWPIGAYHAAHRHQAGAVIVGLDGKGYVLVWPQEAGERPFESGNEDQVVKVEWGNFSVYTPPDNWYHQHFNTSNVEARQLKIYEATNHSAVLNLNDVIARPTVVSQRDGGLLIEYRDEDPEIRRRFESDLAKEGVECTMPQMQGAAS